MEIHFTNSYVDRLFAEKRSLGLHHLISLRSVDGNLPDEFWLFARLVEWVGSTRSGIWQYYEGLPKEKFERMAALLERFQLSSVAEQYRIGNVSWEKPDRIIFVDRWVDAHESEIHDLAFNLIAPYRDYLRDRPKCDQ